MQYPWYIKLPFESQKIQNAMKLPTKQRRIILAGDFSGLAHLVERLYVKEWTQV